MRFAPDADNIRDELEIYDSGLLDEERPRLRMMVETFQSASTPDDLRQDIEARLRTG